MSINFRILSLSLSLSLSLHPDNRFAVESLDVTINILIEVEKSTPSFKCSIRRQISPIYYFFSLIAFSNLILIGGIRLSAKDSFFYLSRVRWHPTDFRTAGSQRKVRFNFLPADRGIEPRMAGWEARTLSLCYAVPPQLGDLVNGHSLHPTLALPTSNVFWKETLRYLLNMKVQVITLPLFFT